MRIHSLTTRFVLTLLLSTAVPFLVFASFAGDGLRSRQEELVGVLLEGAAESVGSRLANRLEQFYRECSLFRSFAERALEGEISFEEFGDEVELSPSFHEQYQLVILANAEGEVQCHVDSLEQDVPTQAARAAFRPRSVSEHDWFQEIVDDSGEAVSGQAWLDRHLSPFLHRDTTKPSRNPADYSFGLAFPVYAGGKLGVVLALKRWVIVQSEIDAQREDLAREFPSVRAFVLDQDDRILAHSDRTDYGGRFGVAPESESPDPARDVPASWVFHFEEEDDGWLAGVHRVPNIAGSIEWRCAVAASDADLFRQSRQFQRVLLFETIIVAAILVVWALVASRAILRPVRRLALATERISAGDLDARVPAQGRHELADLGRAFNDMASEVARSRDQLRDAERQAAWAEMARQVAHEIKNPLTPMRMSAQLLLRANREKSDRLPELVDRLARTVHEQTDALARIATDFRQFAGEVDRQPQTTSVVDVLRAAERDFVATVESGVALEFDAFDGSEVVDVDRQEIQQVFRNLVQNALEAAGVNGSVRVSARVERGRVWFSVVDSGAGIEDVETKHRLFEPYFTTRSSGTGLGLAICRRIVEAHGGSIEFAGSKPGRTEFRFCLPVSGADTELVHTSH